jgi:PiT family inorganic phosphate transporter
VPAVLLGRVAVAFTLVELLPPDVLTPPDGNPAIAMLLALFLSALIWNVATWWLGIPCSSSHAIIGSLLGLAIVNSVTAAHGLGQGVDWSQVTDHRSGRCCGRCSSRRCWGSAWRGCCSGC